MKNVKFRGNAGVKIPRLIPRLKYRGKPKFRGSARKSAARGKNVGPTHMTIHNRIVKR